MDPNNKKDQKNNQNRNRNMRGVVTLDHLGAGADGGVQLYQRLQQQSHQAGQQP